MDPQKVAATQRILGELKDLTRNPISGFGVTVGLYDNENPFIWKCTIIGPQDTCYKGGLFYLKIIFPNNYPYKSPEIIFTTPIYHLNVKYFTYGTQPLGHVCISTLSNWKPEYKMTKVLPEIFYLFQNNNPKSPYDDKFGSRRNEFMHNRALFDEKARYFTKKYANPLKTIMEYSTDWNFSYP